MKSIELTKNGWKEISTQYIKVTQLVPKAYMSAGDWLTSNQKLYNPVPAKRRKCNMCQKSWKNIDANSNMYSVFTNKGIKSICESCQKQLSEQLK